MTRIFLARRAGLGVALVALLLAALGWSFRQPAATRVDPRAPTPAAESRFAAVSDRFELVGALQGRLLTLWLDRFTDNAPVPGATIEVEIGDMKHVARPVGDRYEIDLPAPPPAGVSPVTITVTAGDDIDLLAADLVVPAKPESTR